MELYGAKWGKSYPPAICLSGTARMHYVPRQRCQEHGSSYREYLLSVTKRGNITCLSMVLIINCRASAIAALRSTREIIRRSSRNATVISVAILYLWRLRAINGLPFMHRGRSFKSFTIKSLAVLPVNYITVVPARDYFNV